MFLPWAGLTLFNSKGEPREAIVALSILESGNWILPVNYGGDIPYKPPFMAWVIAVLSAVFNGGVVTEYLSRLPSMLASTGMCMGLYAFASRARGARFGAVCALICATSFEVFRASMACRLDMLLTACMTGAVMLMFKAREDGDKGRKALCYGGAWLLLTCATLTKGPVGALLPCCAVGVYRLLRRDNFAAVFVKMLGMALAALVIPALWYYKAYELGGAEFLELAYEENIGRLTGTMSYDSHVKPLWYNFATLALGLLPWTLVLIGSPAMRPWRGVRESLRRMRPEAMLALATATVIFCFYCIPESKRSVYLLPVYPFACYGIAVIATRYENTRLMRGYAWFMAALALAVPPAFLILAAGGTAGLAPTPAWGAVMALVPAGASLGWILRRRRAATASALCAAGLYIFYASTAMPAALNPRSDARIVGELESAAEAGKLYSLGHGPGERLYTLNFYLGDRLRALPSTEAASGIESDASILLLTPADTSALQALGYETRMLLPRSCDHRRELYIARRPDAASADGVGR